MVNYHIIHHVKNHFRTYGWNRLCMESKTKLFFHIFHTGQLYNYYRFSFRLHRTVRTYYQQHHYK
jgi:hypothetical protein